MANFFKKKAKLIHIIYGVILALVFILGCGFMTNYQNVVFNFRIDEGNVIIDRNVEGSIGLGNNNNVYDKFEEGIFTKEYCQDQIDALPGIISQIEADIVASEEKIVKYEGDIATYEQQLADYKEEMVGLDPESSEYKTLDRKCQLAERNITNTTKRYDGEVKTLASLKVQLVGLQYDYDNYDELLDLYANNPEFDRSNDLNDYEMIVYDFSKDMNAYNDSIFGYAMFAIICFALLFVFSNHSRRIYYKSNLIVGIILPVAVISFTVFMLIENMNLMGRFNDNYYLFNYVSVLQDNTLSISAIDWGMPRIIDAFYCSSFTFILALVLYIIIIVASLFIAVYSIYRYKSCSEERAEIINKAVNAHD